MCKPPMQRAVDEAARRAGSLSQLAKCLGVTRQALQQWRRNGVPPDRVLALEELSGVSRYEQRPDVYGEGPPKRTGRREVSRAA